MEKIGEQNNDNQLEKESRHWYCYCTAGVSSSRRLTLDVSYKSAMLPSVWDAQANGPGLPYNMSYCTIVRHHECPVHDLHATNFGVNEGNNPILRIQIITKFGVHMTIVDTFMRSSIQIVFLGGTLGARKGVLPVIISISILLH